MYCHLGLPPKNTAQYKLKWNKGTVLEENNKKVCWDFQYKMRKTTTVRRSDTTVDDNKGENLHG